MGYDKSLEYIADTQTLVGTKKRELMDTATGELMTVDQVTKRTYGTKEFWKVYLMDFLSVLGIFDSKQVDIFIYIVENTNKSTNMFIGTYEKIAKDVGASSQTIARILKKLVENNFVKRVQNGVWLVNPNVLMQGNDTKRQILLSYYKSEEPIDKITFSRTKRKTIEETTHNEQKLINTESVE
jgi:predicted transcriptional regulator